MPKTRRIILVINHDLKKKVFASKTASDDNHKPEMALALTPFEGLCGFRPLAEISHFLSSVSQLRKLIGESAVKEFQSAIKGKESSEDAEDVDRNKKALQAVFSALMHYQKEEVLSAAEELVSSAKQEAAKFAGGGIGPNDGKELAEIIIRLNDQFKGDIGLFVFFFLNYVKLQPGEAMFLKADDIHAYISGGKAFPCLSPPPAGGVRLSGLLRDFLNLFINFKSRYNRMHGLIRQRRARRLLPQISRHQNPNQHADLQLRAHLLPKNATRRLPLRDPQPSRLLLLLLRNPV